MNESSISHINQLLFSLMRRTVRCRHEADINTFSVDQCRVHSMLFLVHFVNFLGVYISPLRWSGGSNRFLTAKQPPWQFFGAMLTLGKASELRCGPTIGQTGVNCHRKSIFSPHVTISSGKESPLLRKRRGEHSQKTRRLLMFGQLVRHPLNECPCLSISVQTPCYGCVISAELFGNFSSGYSSIRICHCFQLEKFWLQPRYLGLKLEFREPSTRSTSRCGVFIHALMTFRDASAALWLSLNSWCKTTRMSGFFG